MNQLTEDDRALIRRALEQWVITPETSGSFRVSFGHSELRSQARKLTSLGYLQRTGQTDTCNAYGVTDKGRAAVGANPLKDVKLLQPGDKTRRGVVARTYAACGAFYVEFEDGEYQRFGRGLNRMEVLP